MSAETEVHRAERNVAAYQQAARELSFQINRRGVGEILFAPGDATAYPFIVIAKGREVPEIRGEKTVETVHRSSYLVILAASFGGTYEWGGQLMHWDYCAAKWTNDCHEWTGRVVCALLNALSPLLAEPPS